MNIDYNALEKTAFNARKKCLSLLDRGCFLGSAFSCTEIITYLYSNFLNINQNNIVDTKRDYFFLSKGHAVIMQYAIMNELGISNCNLEKDYLKYGTNLYFHPNVNIPGIDFYTGSLGHASSIGLGIAMDIKFNNENGKVAILTGDGELNEGSNWEAFLIANAKKVDNLLIIVDRNRFQANAETESLSVMDPLKEKFESFGCSVKEIDGHDFGQIADALNTFPFEKGKVSVIITNTVRGKSIKSIENNLEKWYFDSTEDEIAAYKEELSDYYKRKNVL